jgi:hypothetical protein
MKLSGRVVWTPFLFVVVTEICFAGEQQLVSGIEGTTIAVVMSGIPGGPRQVVRKALEFAIAPIEEEQPMYHLAQFVTSDEHGDFAIRLAPGRYWIGPKAKAIDPQNYFPTVCVFQEQIVNVRADAITKSDLTQECFAP